MDGLFGDGLVDVLCCCCVVPREMQRDLHLLQSGKRNRDISENEAIVLGFGAKVQQKENGVRAQSSDICA